MLLLASQGSLLRLSPTDGLSGSGVLGIANAASLALATSITDGELVTIFGVGLGPSEGITAVPDSNGVFPTELGGVQVLVGSKPAPLLYVGLNQINFQVPFQFSPATVQVVTPSVTLPEIQMTTALSLGIFRQGASTSAAALNQDGSINSPDNPAKPGSIVSLFVTGLQQSLQLQEGTLWPPVANPFLLTLLNIRITADSYPEAPLPILYVGAAPTLINGVVQINIQLPPELKDPLLTLSRRAVSTTFSNTVRVHAH